MDERLIEERELGVERVREELRRLVRSSERTQREIEQANDFAPSYLSQVLKGNIALTLRHLYGILLALDRTPEEFFGRLAGRFDTVPGFDEIREKIARYDAAIDQLERDGLVKPQTGRRR